MYNRPIRYSLFFSLGFVTIASQIIILRRLLVAFGGNELTIGIALGGWMAWTGIANLILGRFSDRLHKVENIIPILLLVFALVLPAIVAASTIIKPILGLPTTELVNVGTIFVGTGLVLAPVCLINGALLNLFSKTGKTGRAPDIGLVYLFDSLGAALGGVVYSWLAIELLNPMTSSLILSLILLVGFFVVATKRQLLTGIAVFILIIGLTLFSRTLSHNLIGITWKGYNSVISMDTKFQNLSVSENRGEWTLFSDGVPLFTVPNKPADETLARLPIIESERFNRILIIGGGISGVVGEINMLGPRKITYLQIDPKVTELETKVMGGRIPQNIKIVNSDGRSFINKFNPETEKPFDAVIINIGDPTNESINRYYTMEFFGGAKKVLAREGIIFFGISEVTNYLNNPTLELLGTIYTTLKTVFNNVVIVPLDKYYFVATAGGANLTDKIDILRKREAAERAPSDFFATQTLQGTDQTRIDETNRLITRHALIEGRINRDDKPIAYFFGLKQLGEKLGPETKKIFEYLSRVSFWWIIILVLLAGIISIVLSRKSGTIGIWWSLFAAGWTALATEILILLKYQSEVGLLFYMLGILMAAFMVGLSVGTFLTIHAFRSKIPRPRHLLFLLASLAAFLLVLSEVTDISFVLANFLLGLICGAVYQTSAGIIIDIGVGRTAGLINGADYIGSALGGLTASLLLVPLFGFEVTKWICIAILIIAIFANSLKVGYKFK